MSLNIRSIPKSLDKLLIEFNMLIIDIRYVSETWLNEHTYQLYNIPNFELFWCTEPIKEEGAWLCTLEILVNYGLRLSSDISYLPTFSMQMVYVSRETYTICMLKVGKWFMSLERSKPSFTIIKLSIILILRLKCLMLKKNKIK